MHQARWVSEALAGADSATSVAMALQSSNRRVDRSKFGKIRTRSRFAQSALTRLHSHLALHLLLLGVHFDLNLQDSSHTALSLA